MEVQNTGHAEEMICRRDSNQSSGFSRRSSSDSACKVSPRGSSRPPSRLYDYNRRESANYYKSTLNMLDERELERRSSCSASSSKSSMLVGEEEQVDNKMVDDRKCTQQNKMGEEEVIVTEEQVGDFLVHCYAQKEKETNLAIVARGTLLSRGPKHSGRPVLPRFSNAAATRDFYVSALAKMERDR